MIKLPSFKSILIIDHMKREYVKIKKFKKYSAAAIYFVLFKKKMAIVPGPEWAPIVAPIVLM